MTPERADTVFIVCVFAALIGVIIFVVLFQLNTEALRADASARCLAAGWTEARVTAKQIYCIARENQSDIVRTLEWAERNPR